MSKWKKVFAIVLAVILMSGIIRCIDISINKLDQYSNTLVYNGAEYSFCDDTKFHVNIDTSGYEFVGYGKLNLFPYLRVYAEEKENPNFLVFAGGEHAYFLKETFPDRLSTVFAKVLFKNGFSTVKEVDSPTLLADGLSPELTYEPVHNGKNTYTSVIRLYCYLDYLPDTYWVTDVFECAGCYYLEYFVDHTANGNMWVYRAVIEGSELHSWILEVLADTQAGSPAG